MILKKCGTLNEEKSCRKTSSSVKRPKIQMDQSEECQKIWSSLVEGDKFSKKTNKRELKFEYI